MKDEELKLDEMKVSHTLGGVLRRVTTAEWKEADESPTRTGPFA